MLVLSRKVNEVIHIGPDIALMVQAVNTDHVIFRFETPRSIRAPRPLMYEQDIVEFGADISMVLCEVNRNQARLGFTAPRSVTIVRQELLALDDPRRLLTPYANQPSHANARFLRGTSAQRDARRES